MNALDYPVSAGYGYTGAPYSKNSPHRGIDFAAPMGSPVTVAGTQIALSGNSGAYKGETYDPHTHAQAGRDEWAQNTIDPAPYIGKPGTVFRTGTAPEWGKYVCVKVGDVYVYYCHLSRIDVKQGQVIKEEIMKPSKETLRIIHALVGGWDIEKSLNGDYDKQFADAAGWKDINTFVYEQFSGAQGGTWRSRLIDLQKGKLDGDAAKKLQAIKDVLGR